MMIAVTGSIPNVTGSRIAMVAAGPSPGNTPMNMPMTTPMRQYSRLVGSKTTPNPLSTGERSTAAPLEQVRNRHGEGRHGHEVEPDHDREARDHRHAPALAAEELQPHEAQQRGRNLEPDHADDDDEANHGRDPGEHEPTGPGEPLRVGGPAARQQQRDPEHGEHDADEQRPGAGPWPAGGPGPQRGRPDECGDPEHDNRGGGEDVGDRSGRGRPILVLDLLDLFLERVAGVVRPGRDLVAPRCRASTPVPLDRHSVPPRLMSYCLARSRYLSRLSVHCVRRVSPSTSLGVSWLSVLNFLYASVPNAFLTDARSLSSTSFGVPFGADSARDCCTGVS